MKRTEEQRKKYYLKHLEWRKNNKEHWKNCVGNKFSEYKISANKRGLLFKINRDEFKTFYNKECYYCGDIINGVGIDRKDNTLGYINDNIVPCCEVCNRMKLCQSENDFIIKCKKIANNFK